jgi:hypothetical protein
MKKKKKKGGVLALLEHKSINLPKEKKHLQTSRKYSLKSAPLKLHHHYTKTCQMLSMAIVWEHN